MIKDLRSPTDADNQGFAESVGRSKSAIFGRDEVSYENEQFTTASPPQIFEFTESAGRSQSANSDGFAFGVSWYSCELRSPEFPRTPSAARPEYFTISRRDKVPYENPRIHANYVLRNTSQVHHTICIPRVKNKITKQFIFSIFCNLKLGFIEKVIEIPIKKDDLHKRVLVKIKWNNSDLSSFISGRFDNGQNVKIMYSDPSYWICVPNYQGFAELRGNPEAKP